MREAGIREVGMGETWMREAGVCVCYWLGECYSYNVCSIWTNMDMEDGDGHGWIEVDIGGLQWIQVDKGRQQWTEMDRAGQEWTEMECDCYRSTVVNTDIQRWT